MEGYYLAVISYFQQSGTQASAHFCVNGLQDNASDHPAGEITQMVREQYWAWHVRCWNRYMFGTEHEGFVSNPAWYTEAMYTSSAALQRHLCDAWNIPIDRNHIIGHNEWQNASWVTWMQANWPAIDPLCNDHTDPGKYWNWSHFMTLISNSPAGPKILTHPTDQTVARGEPVSFTASASGAPTLQYQWFFNGTALPGATSTAYSLPQADLTNGGNYSVLVTNQVGRAISSNALLTVTSPPFITIQPRDQPVLESQGATFAVNASGSAPLSYQWRLAGNDIAGAMDSSFTVTAARPEIAGPYSVTISNAYGTITSSNVVLMVSALGAWGDNTFGQTTIPVSATNIIAIAAGAWHNLALSPNGTVIAWGNNYSGQADIPASLTNALAIAAGGYHSLAINRRGAVVAWGANDYGQSTLPQSVNRDIIGIAAGTWHSLALRRDGTVEAWGDNSLGQIAVPELSGVEAIAAGGNHSLALKSDGTVSAWGQNTDSEGSFVGQSVVPWNLSNVVAIAAGAYHSLALKQDGTVSAWGDNSQGQCSTPPELSSVVAIGAGGAHSLALRSDGTVITWGANWNGQISLPPSLTYAIGMAAGEHHSLVLLEGPIPVPQMLDPALNGARFSVIVQTLNRRSYTLGFKDQLGLTDWTRLSDVPGNGTLKVLTDTTASGPQRFYQMKQ